MPNAKGSSLMFRLPATLLRRHQRGNHSIKLDGHGQRGPVLRVYFAPIFMLMDALVNEEMNKIFFQFRCSWSNALMVQHP